MVIDNNDPNLILKKIAAINVKGRINIVLKRHIKNIKEGLDHYHQ